MISHTNFLKTNTSYVKNIKRNDAEKLLAQLQKIWN